MTIRQQREAIALAMGWKFDGRDTWTDKSGEHHQVLYGDTDKYGDFIPPDYPYDLNAMHSVLESGVIKDWPKYISFLAKVLIGDCRPKAAGNHYHVATSILLCATAAQQAEAFLRTMNLWTETQP